jgi:hypothetical protein
MVRNIYRRHAYTIHHIYDRFNDCYGLEVDMLKGWVEICAYTKMTPQTLRKWVREKGFPIILGRKGGGRPITSQMIINAWLADQTEKKGKKG